MSDHDRGGAVPRRSRLSVAEHERIWAGLLELLEGNTSSLADQIRRYLNERVSPSATTEGIADE